MCDYVDSLAQRELFLSRRRSARKNCARCRGAAMLGQNCIEARRPCVKARLLARGRQVAEALVTYKLSLRRGCVACASAKSCRRADRFTQSAEPQRSVLITLFSTRPNLRQPSP